LLERLDYAVMQKLYGIEDVNTTDPNRRYSPPRCIGLRVEMLAGNPRPEQISTSLVESANLSVRHFTRRFTRLTLGWSRKLENHRSAVALFVAAYSFCTAHSTLDTPRQRPPQGSPITSGQSRNFSPKQ
jgi:hypothetical protein